VQQAVSELETAVGRLPRNAVVRYNLGRAYWAKGEMELARTQFRTAVDVQPDYIAPRLALTQIHLSRGEHAQALQAADEIVRLNRVNLSARLLRSMALQGLGKIDEARTELQALIKSNPNSTEPRFRLGLLELNARNYTAAEQVFRQCSTEGRGGSLCQIGLAEVYTGQRDFDKAAALLSPSSTRTRTAATCALR